MSSATSAVYVYCLVAAARRPSRARLAPGLPGGTPPVVTAAGDGLFIVSSDVPLTVFGPPHLEERLRDLDWVSDLAVAHEKTVERFARMPSTTVVPMKMFTMFSTLDKAIADIRERRAAIRKVIARVRGCEEWGVRVTRVLAPPVAPPTDRALRSVRPGSGAAFLAARKDARDRVKASRQRSQDAALSALTALQRLARDVRRRHSAAEPGSNPPLAEAAFLVATPARSRFKLAAHRHAAHCAAAGASLALTGPWPAYNFVLPAEGES